MSYKRPTPGKELFKKYEYVYDEFYDCYICPNNKVLKYPSTKDNYPLRKETVDRTYGKL